MGRAITGLQAFQWTQSSSAFAMTLEFAVVIDIEVRTREYTLKKIQLSQKRNGRETKNI